MASLDSPTQAIFLGLFRHIFHYAIDDHYTFQTDAKKPEEEIMAILQEYKYPAMGDVTKMLLGSASSSQYWPKTLGILDWMVTLSVSLMSSCHTRLLAFNPSDPYADVFLFVPQSGSTRRNTFRQALWGATSDIMRTTPTWLATLRKPLQHSAALQRVSTLHNGKHSRCRSTRQKRS